MENYDSIFASAATENQSKSFTPVDKQAWAEKKQAERQLVYNMIDETAEAMTQDGALFKTGLDVMARFDRYSVGNILLIAAQMPEATKLADFDAWKQNRTYVRKGEDHIKLLEPGEEFRREDGSMGVNYNVKRVFDISQTSAKFKPAKVQHDMRLLLKAMLNNAPCPVEISDKVPDGVGAIYNSEERKVYVRQGMEGQDIFRCLAQELSHAHMDRDDNYTRSRHAFTAYCSAYTLCSRYGVDTKNFSFKTIPETMGNMESQDVRTELAKIRDCANQISMDMSKVLEKGQKERSAEAR